MARRRRPGTRAGRTAFAPSRTGGGESRTLEDTSRSRDTQRQRRAASSIANGARATHSLVSGIEARVEPPRRHARRPCRTGSRSSPTSATTSSASTHAPGRLRAGRMEPSPSTGRAHAGLRWEGIRTRGTVEEGQPEVVNRSSVWTPLLHAVWKPDPKGRDQVRMSLTRSYRSPTLAQPDRAAERQHALSGRRAEHADPARPRRQPEPEARARHRHRHRRRALPRRAAACSAPTSSGARSATTCAA